jgi:protocatechuate 3,4-dioxygenase beta subunit
MRNQGFVFLCIANVLFAAFAADGAARRRQVAPSMKLETPGDKADQIAFTGKILDARGQPVADAKVIRYEVSYGETPYSQQAALVGEKTTGADGTYAFAAPRKSDTYRESYILVKKEGLALGWAVWRMSADQQADVTLGEPKELAGEVVDENGKPLAGVDVSIAMAIIGKEEDRRYLTNYWLASDLLAVKTDGNGRFVFPDMPAEATCELLAKSPGRATVCTLDSSSYRGGVLQLAPGKAGIKVTLPSEAKVQGTVVEKAGGKPVPGMNITVQADPRGLPLPQEPVVSAEDGGFSLGGLAPGRYVVQLTTSGSGLAEWVAEPVTVSVSAGETKSDVKLELIKGGVLEVLVKEGTTGKPVEKASVSIRLVQNDRWTSSVTDPNGLARMRVTPGQYAVSGAYKQGYTRQQTQQDQMEINDGETKRIEYTLTPAPRVTGIVRDEAGNPLAGVKLEIKPSSPEEKTTDADGKFEVSWDPSNWGPQSTTFVLVARDEARNLAATADIDEQTKNLDLKLQPGITFTGKVLNHEGKPLPDARVQVMLRVSNWGSTLGRGETGKTGPDGAFEVKAIPPERQYNVTAMAEGYGTFQVQADAANATDNRMELGEFKLPLADLSVTGVVVDVNDQPVADALVYAYGENQPDRSRDIQTDKEGKFVIEKVCSGPIRLSVNVRGASRLYGYVQTEGGATDVRVVVSERSTGQVFVPKKPRPLAGKPLPDLKTAGVELPADANDRMLLVCLWDMDQRPSRHLITQLTQQAAQLGEKAVTIVALQADKIEPGDLDQWKEKNKSPFPLGCLTGDVENARFAWGAVGLPHLILTDKKHIVIAEGFTVSELDTKIPPAASQ